MTRHGQNNTVAGTPLAGSQGTATTADDLLTTTEVSHIVRLSLDVLAKLRRTSRGPRFFKLGHRSVRYRRADVLAWLADCASPTTDARPS